MSNTEHPSHCDDTPPSQRLQREPHAHADNASEPFHIPKIDLDQLTLPVKPPPRVVGEHAAWGGKPINGKLLLGAALVGTGFMFGRASRQDSPPVFTPAPAVRGADFAEIQRLKNQADNLAADLMVEHENQRRLKKEHQAEVRTMVTRSEDKIAGLSIHFARLAMRHPQQKASMPPRVMKHANDIEKALEQALMRLDKPEPFNAHAEPKVSAVLNALESQAEPDKRNALNAARKTVFPVLRNENLAALSLKETANVLNAAATILTELRAQHHIDLQDAGALPRPHQSWLGLSAEQHKGMLPEDRHEWHDHYNETMALFNRFVQRASFCLLQQKNIPLEHDKGQGR